MKEIRKSTENMIPHESNMQKESQADLSQEKGEDERTDEH